MPEHRPRLLAFFAFTVILALAWAPPLLAQKDTGVITVRVLGPDGGPLPGVKSVARGPVGTQTQYTLADGTARFPGLYPGKGYSVGFSLAGFNPVVRDGLIVSVGQTTSVEDVMLELATFEETVTVTGDSPMLDVKDTQIAVAYSDEMIDRAPTSTGLWAGVLDHIPGVVFYEFDVGGNTAIQYLSPRAYGSSGRQTSYNINGAETTNPEVVGATSMYYSTGSFEEVGVATFAHDIETKTPGPNINMVIKSGSNDWRARFRYFYQGDRMVSDNVDEDLESESVTWGNPNELLSDLDIQGGGPVVRDRAWFFVDYWDLRQREAILGLEEKDDAQLRDWTVNVNTQVTDNDKLSGRLIFARKYRSNRGASRFEPYLGRIQDSNTFLPQLQWQSVFSQSAFLDVRYSRVDGQFPLTARDPESINPLPGYVDRPARYDFSIGDYVPRPSAPTFEFDEKQLTDAVYGTLSWYVGGDRQSHDVKFGANYRSSSYLLPFTYPHGYRPYVRSGRVGDPQYDPENNPNWVDGVPVEVRLYTSATLDIFDDGWKPNNALHVTGYDASAFIQDTATFANRLTVTAGLRFDYAENGNPAQNRLDSYWAEDADALYCPACFRAESFAAQPNVVTWSNLLPRVGVVYDLLGDGRWALKFDYSRYADPLGLDYAEPTNSNYGGREDWNWFDPNGDGVFQFGEQTTFRDAVLPSVSEGVDPDLESPITNEFAAGIEHELSDNILIGLTAIVRRANNRTGMVDIGRPFGPMFDAEACLRNCTPLLPWAVDPWYPVETVDPGNDGVIGTDDDGGPVTVWAVNPATYGTSFRVRANYPKYGFPGGYDYTGLLVQFEKRWRGNWQMLASYNYGRSYQEGGGTTPNDAYNGRRQEQLGFSRPHMFKVTGNYLFADPIGVNVGLFLRAMSADAFSTDYYYDDSVIEPPNSPYPNQGSTFVILTALGEGDAALDRPERLGFVTVLDVRAEKQFSVGRYGVLHLYLDVFNLFNANPVTWRHWTVGINYWDIGGILSPRVVRIGGAWDF